MMFCFFVKSLDILIAISTASEPLFQKKNESREEWGMRGSKPSMSLK
jgi:hypothetical protein